MKSQHPLRLSASRGFISAQLAIVLAVIAGGTVLVAYEWHAAHPKAHHAAAGPSHHHHPHEGKSAATH